MEGGDGFTTTATKGGKKQPPQQKVVYETPLPSVVDAQKKKKKTAAFTYGSGQTGVVVDEEVAKTEDQQLKSAVPEEKQVSAASKMLTAFAASTGGDGSDDDKPKKGKKHQHNKKDRQQKKGKKKAQDESEEEADEDAQPLEEEKGEAAEEVIAEKKEFPMEVIYCRVCGVPPEYCMFDKKDSSECKAWVLQSHPALHDSIYGAPVEGAAVEEKKESDQVQPQKKKKKVSIAPTGNADVKVYKTKRGGKKAISIVVGLHHYGIILKDMSKVMSKYFACSAAYVADDEKYGESIHVQGDINVRFPDFHAQELTKYKVPFERVKFEEVKKKKKAEATEEGDGDEQ